MRAFNMTRMRGLALLVVVAVTCALALPARSAWADGEQDQPTLTVTVVENLPAEPIEDDGVPLAAGDAADTVIGLPQVVLMAAVLAASVGYAQYGRRCDERIFALRLQVIEAEKALTEQRGGVSWTS